MRTKHDYGKIICAAGHIACSQSSVVHWRCLCDSLPRHGPQFESQCFTRIKL